MILKLNTADGRPAMHLWLNVTEAYLMDQGATVDRVQSGGGYLRDAEGRILPS